ncbi:MAG TPA: hypothetical protein VFS21_02005 [Roseiflexaceae bacterium]|nr:hypothetical protein [Roseiflexaceae bacterium]
MGELVTPEHTMPAVSAMVAFLNAQRAQTPEVLELTRRSNEVIGAGELALQLFREWFEYGRDGRALKALDLLIDDPDDQDFQNKLAREVIRTAQQHEQFASDLRQLSARVMQAAPQTTNNFHNYSSNNGFQGTNAGSITINNGNKH